MKSTSNIIFGLLLLFAFSVLPSCSEDEGTVVIKNTFSIPKASAPLDGAIIAATTSVEIKWESTGGATNSWDVYFGEDSHGLELIAENHTSQAITVNDLVEGHTYYWAVECVDAQGIVTTSPVYSFTVKVNMNIDNFVGLYDCDEPDYAVYDVNITKINSTTIEIDNFWDNGWALQYEFDDFGVVTIIPKVFKTSPSTTYTVTGEGTYDNATGTFVVDYVVIKKVYAFALDENGNPGTTITTTTADSNTHTFTRKP